jgi:hypothetical protein
MKRPTPERPLFQAPGQVVPARTLVAGRDGALNGRSQNPLSQCGLPGCDNSLPHSPGNEKTVRYCSQEHRREARAQRRHARYSDEQ